MKLGFVTYQIGAGWDVGQIIRTCAATGFAGVELRTTHAHGVEVELSAAERADVRARFADAGVEIAGLGSAFEFHAVDPAVVRRNIAGTIAYARLAADLGCPGVKVRPNGLQTGAGVPEEKTLEQIGLALRECAQAAAGLGVAVRIEVHGPRTQHPRRMRAIIDHADHDNAFICWNSNPGEVVDGSIDEAYALLRHKIGLVHITELHTAYPWRDLFTKLHRDGYAGYTLAEIPGSPDAERILRYYRALWDAYRSEPSRAAASAA